MFKKEVLRIMYLVAWNDTTLGGLGVKEKALVKIRELVNVELRKVRREIKKAEKLDK